MQGRSARWASMEAEAAAPPQKVAADPGAVPDAEELSERAMAAARSAETLASVFSAKIEALGDRDKPFAYAGYTLALTGGCAALAVAFGFLPITFLTPSLVAIAILFGAVGVCGAVAAAMAASDHRETVTHKSNQAAARQCGIAARRIDTALAGFYGRGDPRPDDRRMVAALLAMVERDIVLLEQKTGTAPQPLSTSLRRHERIVPRQTKVMIYLGDGRALTARIADISLSGVAVETELADLAVGAEVTVGSRPARAVRKLKRGMAFEFKDALDKASFSPDILL